MTLKNIGTDRVLCGGLKNCAAIMAVLVATGATGAGPSSEGCAR